MIDITTLCPVCGERGEEVARDVYMPHTMCERRRARDRVIAEIEWNLANLPVREAAFAAERASAGVVHTPRRVRR